MKKALFTPFLFVIISPMLITAEPITTETLLQEMVNTNRLAEFPKPSYKTVQLSSYDHRSDLPGGPGWFANSDGFGQEPIPNFEEVIKLPDGNQDNGQYVMCDVEGPGAIVRVWTATIGGEIKLYLDGKKTPVWQGPAQDFLQPKYTQFAEAAGLDESIFQGTFSQRNAGYFPIPFAEHCRIVWTGNHKKVHFYQIQVRLYESNANVETFEMGELESCKEQIIRTADALADPDIHWQYRSSQEPIPLAASIAAGRKKEILSLEGPQAIERLTLKIHAQDIDKALRQTLLHISFDNYPWGQVQCPVGDFFGAAPGINPYQSTPFTVHPDGTMVCRFTMPFESSCKITIDNRGDQDVTLTGSALPMNYQWNDRSMHFRARWRIDHGLVAASNPPEDIPFLLANGQGLYVGTVSYIMNTGNIPTSYGNWWGEGDEKIFVDDDTQPSTFGTGSEDYYNYAWSSADIWQHPYCGQPRNDGPGNRGFVTNHRWHILDPLPFQYRIAFYMELFSHDTMPGFAYGRIAYHYGRPGLIDDHMAITNEDLREQILPPNWEPVARMGGSNSQFYQAEALLKDRTNITFEKNNLWSGSQLMVWRPQADGDTLDFSLPILEDGRYTIRLVAARTPQSGSIISRLNGHLIGLGNENQALNLNQPYRTLLRSHTSRRLELTKGNHQLQLEYANEETKSIGIDFIWIKKE